MLQNFVSPITLRGNDITPCRSRRFEVAREGGTCREPRFVAIATIDPQSGYPYTMANDIAIDPDCSPYFLVADLAIYARNIEANNLVSIAFAEVGVPRCVD